MSRFMTAPAEDELQPYFVGVVNGNILPLGFVFRLHLVEFETHLAILGSLVYFIILP